MKYSIVLMVGLIFGGCGSVQPKKQDAGKDNSPANHKFRAVKVETDHWSVFVSLPRDAEVSVSRTTIESGWTRFAFAPSGPAINFSSGFSTTLAQALDELPCDKATVELAKGNILQEGKLSERFYEDPARAGYYRWERLFLVQNSGSCALLRYSNSDAVPGQQTLSLALGTDSSRFVGILMGLSSPMKK